VIMVDVYRDVMNVTVNIDVQSVWRCTVELVFWSGELHSCSVDGDIDLLRFVLSAVANVI
jgi:hypothetical protein